MDHIMFTYQESSNTQNTSEHVHALVCGSAHMCGSHEYLLFISEIYIKESTYN